MRASLGIAILPWLILSAQGVAQGPRPRYTTLVVEFVGEMNRYIPPVVISTSEEEGKWYKEHPLSEPGQFVVYVEVVPTSVLNEITELALLKRALESAKPADEEPKTPNNVRFTAGIGHDHAQIMVDDQTSTKILKDVVEVVAKYPTLQTEIQEIADLVKPLMFKNVAMGEIEYKSATEAGFRTRGWPHAHFGFTVFKASNGNALTVYYDDFANPDEAKRFFDWKANKASEVLLRSTKTSADGKSIEYHAEFAPERKRRYVEVMWVVGVSVHWIDSSRLDDAMELEWQYRR